MTDAVALIALAGGLDEVTPDAAITPGVVRRSINYEVVAEGGYRRIGGYRRWSGRDVTPEPDAIEVLEVPPLTEAPGNIAQTMNTGVVFRFIATIPRENSAILVIEKQRATMRVRTGDQFEGSTLGYVIDATPELTELESQAVFASVEAYSRGGAQEVPGTGDIAMVQASGLAVFVARMDGSQARISRNVPVRDTFGPGGAWLDSGVIANVGEGARFEAVSYRFDGQEEAIFVVTGTTPPYRIRQREGNLTANPEEINDGVDAHPTHVTVHRNHLFLAYPDGRILHSALGEPMDFTVISGAAELSVGDEITGFQQMPGEALAIYCEDRITILSGASSADWQLDLYSDAAGALPGTLQNMPTAIFCDRRAITSLAASDTYGNFASNALSQRFDPSYQRIRRGGRLFSAINREKSQYRVINEDGRGLFLTFAGQGLAGALEVDFGRRITCIGALDGDEDRVFIGGNDGYLYLLDAGSTFAGEPIDAFLETAEYHYGAPRNRKRFKEVDIEIEGDPRLQMQVTTIYDGGTDIHADSAPVEITREARSTPNYRDDLLSRFAQRFAGLAYLIGTGRAMSLRFEPESGHAHTLKSIAVHFTKRGQTR